ncbi:hypothetical protein [Hafnia phage Pocis76]|uniref:Uncharacterized protein n=1 Tax=Hafnia phage Pocis76 TaxID=2831174 RepID=A0A8E7FME6_9CAUD|nr:hypothetical protein [Hafnia phage Pocis76]
MMFLGQDNRSKYASMLRELADRIERNEELVDGLTVESRANYEQGTINTTYTIETLGVINGK